MHCFAAQEFANRRAQHGTAVGRARVRCRTCALQLQLPAFALRIDRFTQRDGAAVTELTGPVAELVSAIVGCVRLHAIEQRVTAEYLRKGGASVSTGSMSSIAATSREYAINRGAATGVGSTREYNAPCTCRRPGPVVGSAGSSRTKALSKLRDCIRWDSQSWTIRSAMDCGIVSPEHRNACTGPPCFPFACRAD